MDKCQNCQLEFQFQCDHEDCLRSEISEIINPTGILTIIPVDVHTMNGDLFGCLNEIDKQNDIHEQQIWIDYFNSCNPTVDFYHRHDIWQMCLRSNYMQSMKLCSMTTKQKSEMGITIQSLLDWVYKETPGYNLIRLLDIKSDVKNLKKLTNELIANGLTSINIDVNSIILNKEKFLERYPTRDLIEIELELTTKATCNQSDALNRILCNLNLRKIA